MRGFVAPPAPQVVYQRIPASWRTVNDRTLGNLSDYCVDTDADCTNGPLRTEWTSYYRHIMELHADCWIRDFVPGYAMRMIYEAGEVGEGFVDFDLSADGVPRSACSFYDPATQYVFKNNVECWGFLRTSALLALSVGRGGSNGEYVNQTGAKGFEYVLTLHALENLPLPTDFGRPCALEVPTQQLGNFTSVVPAAPPWESLRRVVTAPAHGMLCGSQVLLTDDQPTPTELAVRMFNLTADTFEFDWRDSGQDWTGGQTGMLSPVYGPGVAHISASLCP